MEITLESIEIGAVKGYNLIITSSFFLNSQANYLAS